MKTLSVPYYRQQTDYWCGPAIAQMILASFGIRERQVILAQKARTSASKGTGRAALLNVFRSYGLVAPSRRYATLKDIARVLAGGTPIVVNYVDGGQGHFSLITGIDERHITFNGPYHGKGYRMLRKQFMHLWEKRDCWMLAIREK
jgi:ABC-type bacteriocin/lantibiotic exporter with double-glycine peptidase domain